MAAISGGAPTAINDDVVELPLPDKLSEVAINGDGAGVPLPVTPSKAAVPTTGDSDQNKPTNRICFAPIEQPYNHGSDRLRPLRTMPFDSETWIGDLDHLGNRVWPHPSFNELLARCLTGNPRFPLPDTVPKENRFQSLRLRCCGDECCPTTQSPPVDYETPSRLETLSFERTQNVVIYPFYVRLSKATGLQRLFTIVHRHENGKYRFWKVDGAYHESYGLAKGSISMFQSPRSARSTNIGSLGSLERRSTTTPTRSGKSAAQFAGNLDDTPLSVVQETRVLTRSEDMQTKSVDGQDDDPFVDQSLKRRIVAGSSAASGRKSKCAKVPHKATSRFMARPRNFKVERPSSTSPNHSQSGHTNTNGTSRPLLHIKEVCMLAYHLTGPALQLMYGKDTFTIESGEGSLIDPTTESPFLITEQHAQYVLYSRKKSLKAILSKDTTRSIDESANGITGGVVLLSFGGSSARDAFITRIKLMVGVEGIGCVEDLAIESMYHQLSEQLSTRRTAFFDDEAENAAMSEEPTEQVQSLPTKNDAMVGGGGATSCPPAMTDNSSFQVAATPVSQRYAAPLATPASRGALQFSLPVNTSTSPISPQAVAIDSTASQANQAQDTTAMVLFEPNIPTCESAMKTELYDLLREMYTKYPGTLDDDQIEKMALSLKVSLLAGEQERVRELRMDLKAYLIAHHG